MVFTYFTLYWIVIFYQTKFGESSSQYWILPSTRRWARCSWWPGSGWPPPGHRCSCCPASSVCCSPASPTNSPECQTPGLPQMHQTLKKMLHVFYCKLKLKMTSIYIHGFLLVNYANKSLPVKRWSFMTHWLVLFIKRITFIFLNFIQIIVCCFNTG